MRAIALLVLAPLLGGCGTYYRITGVRSVGQGEIFRDGRKALLSEKRHTVTVGVGSISIPNEARATLHVAVKNGSDADFVFSTQDITAYAPKPGTDRAVVLKVFSYKELVREELEAYAYGFFAASMAGAADSLGTATSAYPHTHTYSGQTMYDFAGRQRELDAAAARSQNRINNLTAQSQGEMRDLTATILKKQTVLPGEWHGGLVKIETPRFKKETVDFLICVKVAGEEHWFRFRKIKDKS